MRKLFVIPVLVATLGLTACGGRDAGKGTRDTGDALGIVNMPNHFNNVAVKCFRGNGLYVTNNSGDGGTGSSLAVVIKDPVCNGGVR